MSDRRTVVEVDGPDIDAYVVMDLTSYRHRLKDLRNEGKGPLPQIELEYLAALLSAYGFRIRELSVSGAFVPVDSGDDSDRMMARKRVTRNRQWWVEQEKRWSASRFRKVPLRRLDGGFDGQHEVGVDALVAAAALDALRRSMLELDTASHGAQGPVVIVCSHDSDMAGLHAMTDRVPVLLAGAFTRDDRLRLVDDGVPWLLIGSEEFRGLAPGICPPLVSAVERRVLGADKNTWPQRTLGAKPGDLILTQRTGVTQTAISSSMHPSRDRMSKRRKAVRDAATVAVVDPYGMANASIRSIGAGELPDAGSVRALLESMGWQSPISVLATLPDLNEYLIGDVDQQLSRAWLKRDRELDAQARSMDMDGDPSTEQQRAELQPARARPSNGFRRDMAGGLKRLTTGLLCDLWLTATVNPQAQRVLISEDTELVFALDALPGMGIHTYDGTVRVGVHANRYRRLNPKHGRHTGTNSAGAGSVTTPFVILTAKQLSELTRVGHAPYGMELRRIMRLAVEQQVQPVPVGLDPETGAQIVRVEVDVPTEGNGVEGRTVKTFLATSVRSATVRSGSSAEVAGSKTSDDPAGDARNIDLVFDPAASCSQPILSTQVTTFVERAAWVSAQDSTEIDVDWDGYAEPDATVRVGHTSRRWSRGARVVIVETAQNRWLLADPGGDMAAPADAEQVEVVTAEGDRLVVRSLSDGTSGPLIPPPGRPGLGYNAGDRLIAVRHIDEDLLEWAALSSPLAHLQPDTARKDP